MRIARLPEVVRALNRGVRSMGYYDATHPVFEAARREAFEALQSLWVDTDRVTLGGARAHLVVDAEGAVLEDEPARALAERMFQMGVVALRLYLDVRPEDLGRLLEGLSERPERIRAQGGLRAVLEGWGVAGLEVLEVDFGALFAGDRADLDPLVGSDPVAELALRGVLRFREGEEGAGRAIAVDFERLDDPESLGGFLDELMADAGPAVVEGGQGFITADDFADQASRAYLLGTAAQARAGAPEAALAESANALSRALVRLSPDARFALLRKLAGQDEDADPAAEEAAARLGGQLDDAVIQSAIGAALMEHPGDPDVVRAVGNVIRRLRPVESKRRALLESLDRDQAARGAPLDGVIWQQIRAQAERDPGLGMLELAVTEHRDALTRAAHARRVGAGPPFMGQDVLRTQAGEAVERWARATLADLAADPGRLDERLLERLEADALAAADDPRADEGAARLVRALLLRGDGASARPARAAAVRLLDSPAGGRWAARLLEAEGLPPDALGEVALAALEHTTEAPARQALIARLAGLGPPPLWRLGAERLPHAGPRRVGALVAAGFACDPALGLKLAKVALKNPDLRVKEGVLRGLARQPRREVVGTLALAAGWKGDRQTRALLGLSAPEPDAVHRLQLAAVGALGASKSPLAARPLLDLLTRGKLFSDAATEALRVAAVQALLTNGTDPARAALEEAKGHKKRAVREAARRVLGGRP